jgi:hypothetical protein
MSEKANSAYLREAIQKNKRQKIAGWIQFVIGTSLIGSGLFLMDPPLSYWSVFGGLVFAIVGFYTINVSIRKESLLIKDSSVMPKVTPTSCPACGKRISQENYEFCPFCGKSLKS